jgi:hypothetical protein
MDGWWLSAWRVDWTREGNDRVSTKETVSADFHRASAAETSAAFAMLWEVQAFHGVQIPSHVDPTQGAQAEALAVAIRALMERKPEARP